MLKRETPSSPWLRCFENDRFGHRTFLFESVQSKRGLQHKTTTILPVSDIYETLSWYERALGFETVYIHGEGLRGEAEDFANYAILQRDAVVVHFIMDEGGPVWTRAGTGHLHLTVRDVDAVYSDVRVSGITVHRELRRENWPARGFDLLDPSGNLVHLEQPT